MTNISTREYLELYLARSSELAGLSTDAVVSEIARLLADEIDTLSGQLAALLHRVEFLEKTAIRDIRFVGWVSAESSTNQKQENTKA